MNLITKFTEKFLKVLVNVYIVTLGSMAVLGVLFMAYQIFIEGVVADFGMYR